jgi:hypothetical protein
MGERSSSKLAQRAAPADHSAIAFSNGIRLTGRQWLAVALVAVLLVVFAPSLWKQVENFPLEPDQRMPHDLSNDYWLYERYAGLAAEQYPTLLLGDSVVWGEYVSGQETLSHYLNELVGKEQYANLGLDGAHPLALSGLIEHYAGKITRKNVVLQCNPLWMSSRRADLQDEKSTECNHPRLVAQFVPKIPSYREEMSTRIGIAVEQHLPFNRWTNHLQQAYYDRSDVPSWTLEHPYANPFEPLARGLPPRDHSRRHLSQPWYESGISKQDYPWVDLEASLQWHAFQRVVGILQQRGNRVFVLVGPFNEHLLNRDSLQRYQVVKATLAAWLQAQQIAHALPPPLESGQYGDASHPLALGYAALARQLLRVPFFRSARPQTVSGR